MYKGGGRPSISSSVHLPQLTRWCIVVKHFLGGATTTLTNPSRKARLVFSFDTITRRMPATPIATVHKLS